MKKKLFVCLLLLASVTSIASAQQKGDRYIGGSLSIATSTAIIEGDAATTVNFGVAPEFGYFVADKLRVSLGLSYSLAYNDVATHTVVVGPSIAYYVRLADNFYYLPELFVGFEYAGNRYSDGYGVGIGLSVVGFEFKPKPNIGISFNVLSLGYEFVSMPYWGVSASGISFQLGLKSSIGIKCYF